MRCQGNNANVRYTALTLAHTCTKTVQIGAKNSPLHCGCTKQEKYTLFTHGVNGCCWWMLEDRSVLGWPLFDSRHCHVRSLCAVCKLKRKKKCVCDTGSGQLTIVHSHHTAFSLSFSNKPTVLRLKMGEAHHNKLICKKQNDQLKPLQQPLKS